MSNDSKTAFTTEEAEISRLIVEAHNKFTQLEKQHTNEAQEWVSAIHQLQNVLGWRVLRREFPFDFPVVTEGGSYPVLEYAYPGITFTLKDSPKQEPINPPQRRDGNHE